MCEENLRVMYRIYLHAGNQPSQCLSDRFGFNQAQPVSEDDLRNVEQVFRGAFGAKCRPHFQQLLCQVLEDLGRQPFRDDSDAYSSLAFLQYAVVTAQWKYQCDVGGELSEFACDYDRMDVASERRRLFELAKERFQ
jgi:hypothetical protein